MDHSKHRGVAVVIFAIRPQANGGWQFIAGANICSIFYSLDSFEPRLTRVQNRLVSHSYFMPQLILYHDYSRQEVQEIFVPEAKFTTGAD
jgi:hypothetical protein